MAEQQLREIAEAKAAFDARLEKSRNGNMASR